ncbi:MAG: LytTR family DNA-binding domain-containing protein [Bacteroidota bacterium]
MHTYKTIIVDDEYKLREVMAMELREACPELVIVGSAGNIDEAYQLIKKQSPHIVFLDIAMPGGSGFDLLLRFEQIEFEVIFATGFNDYAIDALKVSAVDYLLKPIRTSELKTAVEKAKVRIEDRQKIERYHHLLHNIQHIGEQATKIALPGLEAYQYVAVYDIIRCEGWERYTRIHLKDGTILVSSYSIGTFKNMLENYDFYSVHRSHLVNTQWIDRYRKEGIVVLLDGTEIPVSRRRREDFLRKVMHHLRK